VLAADVSPWLRPDAAPSPDRLFCHVHGRAKNQAQLIPGWPYSVVAAEETGSTFIRLQVEHLPADRDPKPRWLWSSRTGASPEHVDRLWQAFAGASSGRSAPTVTPA
jgi:hypothetical protein